MQIFLLNSPSNGSPVCFTPACSDSGPLVSLKCCLEKCCKKSCSTCARRFIICKRVCLIATSLWWWLLFTLMKEKGRTFFQIFPIVQNIDHCCLKSQKFLILKTAVDKTNSAWGSLSCVFWSLWLYLFFVSSHRMELHTCKLPSIWSTSTSSHLCWLQTAHAN